MGVRNHTSHPIFPDLWAILGYDFGAQKHRKSSSKWINHWMRKRKGLSGSNPACRAECADALGTYF